MATIKYLDLEGLKTLYGVLNQKIADAKPTKVSELVNDKGYQTENQVENIAAQYVAELVNGAPAEFDTLKEIADALNDNDDAVAGIVTTLATKANSDDVYTKTEVDGLIGDVENDFVPLTAAEIQSASNASEE